MSNNGFTLTELLAVIAILAVISTIAGFSYTKVMKDNKIKQCEQKVLYIEKQAIKYAYENPDSDDYSKNMLFDSFNEDTVSIDTLVEAGYLIDDENDNDIINPITGQKFTGFVDLKLNNGLISAEYDGGHCE